MKVLLLLIASALIAVGCSSADATAETTSTAGTTGTTASAEKAKCDACGKEVAKADLASHDGKMWCKDCMASHNH